MSQLLKAVREPMKALAVAFTLVRSFYYRTKYTFHPRVKIGKNFRASGRLRIKGPGMVYISDNVKIGMTVDLYTHSPRAEIFIGDGTFLNGTRMSSEICINIGKKCILADCRIMDTDFHGVEPHAREIYNVAPVVIYDNVWLTIGVVVLKGSIIGSGSTVTPNSVVQGTLLQACIYSGNPVKWIRSSIVVNHPMAGAM